MPAQFNPMSVLDGLAEPLAVVGRDDAILYANREFLRACGARGEVENKPLAAVWPAMDRVTAHATWLHGRVSGTPVRFKHACRLGERYEISVQPLDGQLSSIAFRKIDD